MKIEWGERYAGRVIRGCKNLENIRNYVSDQSFRELVMQDSSLTLCGILDDCNSAMDLRLIELSAGADAVESLLEQRKLSQDELSREFDGWKLLQDLCPIWTRISLPTLILLSVLMKPKLGDVIFGTHGPCCVQGHYSYYTSASILNAVRSLSEFANKTICLRWVWVGVVVMSSRWVRAKRRLVTGKRSSLTHIVDGPVGMKLLIAIWLCFCYFLIQRLW